MNSRKLREETSKLQTETGADSISQTSNHVGLGCYRTWDFRGLRL